MTATLPRLVALQRGEPYRFRVCWLGLTIGWPRGRSRVSLIGWDSARVRGPERQHLWGGSRACVFCSASCERWRGSGAAFARHTLAYWLGLCPWLDSPSWRSRARARSPGPRQLWIWPWSDDSRRPIPSPLLRWGGPGPARMFAVAWQGVATSAGWLCDCQFLPPPSGRGNFGQGLLSVDCSCGCGSGQAAAFCGVF